MSQTQNPSPWNVDRFRDQVQSAMVHVKRILQNDKNPTFPSETQHQYDDKYILVEMLSRMAVSSTTQSLFALGLGESQLAELIEWSSSRSVTLRLKATERCSFLRESKRDVDSSTKHVVEGFGAKIVSKTVTTITEYFWKFKVEYEIVAYRGTGNGNGNNNNGNNGNNNNNNSSDPDVISILKRSRETTVMTTTDNAPRSEVMVRDPVDLNISHFLHLLRLDKDINTPNTNTKTIHPEFSVKRNSPSCHTPRRNSDVDQLLDFYRELYGWCGAIRTYFSNCVFTMEKDHGLDLTAIYRLTDVFVPVVPLMNRRIEDAGTEEDEDEVTVGSKRVREIEVEEVVGEEEEKEEKVEKEAVEELVEESKRSSRIRRQGSHDLTTTTSLPPTGLQIQRPAAAPPLPQVVLGVNEAGDFLEEEQRSLNEKFVQLRSAFPPDTATSTLITSGEACILTTLCHVQQVCQHYKDGVDYVEDLLRNQLISAIGKVVKPIDFNNYMRFHNRKIFLPEYQPKVFCYAVRRSLDHAPEGVLSLEDHPCDGSIAEPISTLVHSSLSSETSGCGPMQFTVNAASTISFGGERHLHTYLFHRFENDSCLSELKLRVEARQFSSYIVLIGRITSATTFDPKYGMIVQNKDEIVIPLELETIPSAKEFKDAISSLSPEQQRFAKAFRSMQLESTLFGVCVIQIKPQLERVLNLPADSLTKEIRLTQDLMELFITYQIPSDLVSYDGSPETVCSVGEKINRVKGHVQAIYDMINASKEREIEEKRQEVKYQDPFAGSRRLSGQTNSVDLFDCAFSAPMSIPSTNQFEGFTYSPQLLSSAGPPQPLPSLQMNFGSAPSSTQTFDFLTSELQPQPPQEVSREEVPKDKESQHDLSATQPSTSPSSSSINVVDYTKIPKLLDAKFESMDKEGSVRPTIINVGKNWTKTSKKSLLASPTTRTLGVEDQKKERSAAFDLLDALTKSGGFEVHDASLHVVIAATHCFDRSLVDTVVQRNVNPIEKVEFSSLIMATTIHNKRVEDLICQDQVNRLLEHSPSLLSIE